MLSVAFARHDRLRPLKHLSADNIGSRPQRSLLVAARWLRWPSLSRAFDYSASCGRISPRRTSLLPGAPALTRTVTSTCWIKASCRTHHARYYSAELVRKCSGHGIGELVFGSEPCSDLIDDQLFDRHGDTLQPQTLLFERRGYGRERQVAQSFIPGRRELTRPQPCTVDHLNDGPGAIAASGLPVERSCARSVASSAIVIRKYSR